MPLCPFMVLHFISLTYGALSNQYFMKLVFLKCSLLSVCVLLAGLSFLWGILCKSLSLTHTHTHKHTHTSGTFGAWTWYGIPYIFLTDVLPSKQLKTIQIQTLRRWLHIGLSSLWFHSLRMLSWSFLKGNFTLHSSV